MTQQLPYNETAEKQVLSSMLLSEDTLYACMSDLKPEHFYLKRHAKLFSAMKLHKTRDVSVLSNHIDEDDTTIFEVLELGAFRDCSKSVDMIIDCYKRREIIASAHLLIATASSDLDIPANDIINNHMAIVTKCSMLSNTEMPKKIGTIIPSVLDRLHRQSTGEKVRRVTTGIKSVDDVLYISDSDLIVLGARPSMGKSLFVSEMLRHNAKQGKVCLFFSVEMSEEMCVVRDIFSEAGLNLHTFNIGTTTKSDYPKISEGIDKIKSLPLYIDSEPGITPSKILSKCNYTISQEGCLDLIVIDFLTLCKSDFKTNSKREDVTEIIKGLKSVCKKLNCPMVVLSQLSRALESRSDKRPINSDLMESGDIEAIADTILFLYREHYYTKKDEDINKCELLCGKQRNGLSPWLKELYCDLSLLRIGDVEKYRKEYEVRQWQ